MPGDDDKVDFIQDAVGSQEFVNVESRDDTQNLTQTQSMINLVTSQAESNQ